MVLENSDKSCLVVKNDGIGDLILSSGIITEISERFNGQLDLVTCEKNREIAELIGGVREVFYVSQDRLRFWPFIYRLGFYIPWIRGNDKRIINKLKKKKYDTVIVLRRFIRQSTLIIMSYIRAEKKYCFWQFPTNTTYKVAQRFSKSYLNLKGKLDLISETEYFRGLIENILEFKLDSTPKLVLPESGCANNIKNKKVGLCVGGASSQWPVGYWYELIKSLKSKGYKVFLFGGTDVADMAKILKGYFPDIDDYTSNLTFKESITRLKELSVFIGNDTGFTHFASLIVKKVIIILGGGTFKRFFPWPNTKTQYIIYFGLPCFDCNWQCKYRQKLCINVIRPDDVLNYFSRIIKNKSVKNEVNLNPVFCKYRIAWRIPQREDFYKDI